ncbi:MAG: vitamin K epoxide reductase family protein [Metallosphaera sp.]|uniref:Vitamin K epoxide reductase n=1 Tax=Metallosphaera cuprina (strain Ar-4) TaxID=1006006 RepID=F4G3L4_METCR|nr:vitamin K epoxide reductase family protein [Metallosphaera cuprina]AEB95384.1 vitamin K epoxide reductase [Metallosphaera cuprina Ar-4]
MKAGVVLSSIGLADSAYLLYVTSEGRNPSYCNISSTIDCGKVEFSPFSHFFGVPDALLGVLFFIVTLSLWILNKTVTLRYLWILGSVFVFYLVYTEFLIGSLCIYCTIAQACCLLQGITFMS